MELVKEVATVYEPLTDAEPAHCAQGGLMIPKNVKQVVIRSRIEIPGAEVGTFDTPVKVQ